MPKKPSCLLAFVLIVGFAATALGDDLLPPDWRGDPRTTHAVWDHAWSLPDSWQGDLGPTQPPVWFDTRAVLSADAQIHQEYAPPLNPGDLRTNVVEFVGDDDVKLQLANFWDPGDPGPEKLVRMQITYMWSPLCEHEYLDVEVWLDVWAYDNYMPPTPLPGWNDRLIVPTLVDRFFTGDEGTAGWRTDVLEFTIDPNPMWEEIGIKMRRYFPETGYAGYYGWTEIGGWIDQIVVDTKCLPEPASLSLLACGGLLVLRRRRA